MHSNTRQAVRVDAFGVREMVLGKSRQAHQRTIMHSNTRQALNASTRSVYAKWYWVNHGRLTSEQSCTRTLDRQRTIMHSNTRQALNASTRSVYAKWYWVNHGRLTSERQAHQRTAGSPANAKLTFRYPSSLINHSTLLLERSSAKLLVFYAGSPANNHATRTLDRQRTIMHSSTRQALNASTRSVYAKWYWVNHGRLTSERQAHQRMQSLPSATHRHSSRPCCSSAQAPSFLSFSLRIDAFATRRRGNHMHDHSRFQRDVE